MAAFDLRSAPSPNFGPRPVGRAVDLVVLHYTGMATPEAALRRLRCAHAAVSAHYLINPDGAAFALVDENARSWHAGVSEWQGDSDVNSRSIGIELAHPGHDAAGRCPPFPEAQMAALTRLLRDICQRRGVKPNAVLAHSDVAPGRKIDPGERFDWDRLARLGLAAPTPPRPMAAGRGLSPPEEAVFWRALTRIGYGDWPQPALMDAFRRRWRPQAAGTVAVGPSSTDLRMASALAAAAPR